MILKYPPNVAMIYSEDEWKESKIIQTFIGTISIGRQSQGTDVDN